MTTRHQHRSSSSSFYESMPLAQKRDELVRSIHNHINTKNDKAFDKLTSELYKLKPCKDAMFEEIIRKYSQMPVDEENDDDTETEEEDEEDEEEETDTEISEASETSADEDQTQ